MDAVEIKIFESPNLLFDYAAQDFFNQVMQTVQNKGTFSVALSGGNTPLSFFDTLVRMNKNDIPWNCIQFFFGDERYVPADNAKSNYHMAYEHLFSKVPINSKNIHRIPTEHEDRFISANEYALTIKKILPTEQFDLCYLGLGSDAHTASLMPDSETVKTWLQNVGKTHQPNVTPHFDKKTGIDRITLTPNLINQSKEIIFMATGKDKAIAVDQILQGEKNPLAYPAQLINSVHGKTRWLLDQLAAEKLM